MEELEVSGKTVEEALQKGLEQLGLSQDQVEVTILKKGRSGILGLGAGDATILVKPLATQVVTQAEQPVSDIAKTAAETLQQILALMKVSATVQLAEPVPGTEKQETPSIALNIKGDDLGMLIGRRGQTLSSLRYILRLILAHKTQSRVSLTVDVEGYKQRRYESLTGLALRLADQVKTTGQPVTLEPMPADERRIVHLALANESNISTQSLGEGESRKVVISLKK